MQNMISPLMTELKTELVRIYGEDLKGVYLYGSYARGKADNESDVDILIVLGHFDRYSLEVNRTSTLISSLSLKYGVSISRVFVSENDWVGHSTPFLVNVREEAIPA